MSLLTDAMENCVMLDRISSSDGYGGPVYSYVEGAPIKASIVFNTSMEARIGAAQGVTNLYTVTTSRSVNLQYHDHIKRLSDGKCFEITSDGDDHKTPASTALDMRVVTAAEWRIPNG